MLTAENFSSRFILQSINKASDAYKKNLKLIKKEFSEESVHDFRVSIRRFLALLNLINDVCPLSYFEFLKKAFKKQIKILNPLRDTQVQLLQMKDSLNNFPSLHTYYLSKSNDEHVYINNLRKYIDEYNKEEIDGLIFLQKLKLKNYYCKVMPGYSAFFELSRIDHSNMIKLFSELDPYNLMTYHKLRLATKKFRYVVEFLFDYINYPKELLKKVKQIQTILGELQDNIVFYEELKEFYKSDNSQMDALFSDPAKDIMEKRKRLLSECGELLPSIAELWKPEYFTLRFSQAEEEN